MKRILLVLIILSLVPAAASAGDLQKALKSRWLGAWVVTSVESYSDCSGMHTNNRINGNLVKSGGRFSFEAGELAKLEKVDAKRSRLDLMLSFQEPLLAPTRDGPFTLYNEVSCRIELQVELPRHLVKSKDVAAIEEFLGMVVERHTNVNSAQDSSTWNMREIESYPQDYEVTLAEHAVWKATQYNAMVEAKLEIALEETSRIPDRVQNEPDYMTHFLNGVRTARDNHLGSCEHMMGYMFNGRSGDTSAPAWRDGKNLVYGLEMIRQLPQCFIPVPNPPILETARK